MSTPLASMTTTCMWTKCVVVIPSNRFKNMQMCRHRRRTVPTRPSSSNLHRSPELITHRRKYFRWPHPQRIAVIVSAAHQNRTEFHQVSIDTVRSKRIRRYAFAAHRPKWEHQVSINTWVHTIRLIVHGKMCGTHRTRTTRWTPPWTIGVFWAIIIRKHQYGHVHAALTVREISNNWWVRIFRHACARMIRNKVHLHRPLQPIRSRVRQVRLRHHCWTVQHHRRSECKLKQTTPYWSLHESRPRKYRRHWIFICTHARDSHVCRVRDTIVMHANDVVTGHGSWHPFDSNRTIFRIVNFSWIKIHFSQFQFFLFSFYLFLPYRVPCMLFTIDCSFWFE